MRGPYRAWWWICAALAAGAAIAAARSVRGPAASAGAPPDPADAPAAAAAVRHPVIVNRPAGPPRVESSLVDALGEPVTVACSSCHSIRAPDASNRTAADLDEFHQGLTFIHGTTTCHSCHGQADYDALRLADGRAIPFTEVMTLCAQCHGRQATSYEHGAHGGMTGYWDLARGPRLRNGCTDCHNPHAPAFPAMQPTFKPRDRFLGSPREGPHG
jgi:hypothetical protein